MTKFDYTWLREEITRVHTPGFFKIHAPRLPIAKSAPLDSDALPPDYRAFAQEFGTTLLFRDGNHYLLRVSDRPWRGADDRLICFGGFDDRTVSFASDAIATGHGDVFDCTNGTHVAPCFCEWLRTSFYNARHMFSSKEWTQIVAGPPPFTQREQAIVDARRLFQWSFEGHDDNGHLRIHVRNLSELVLPYLSLGVRALDGSFDGGIWLDVSSIAPGAAAVVTHPGYAETALTSEITLFEKEDPTPATRDRFWEFRRR